MQLDNPIAFAVGPTQLLSLAHLHAQYAWLMVAPARMCSDWSYPCVTLVEQVSDWRNLLSIATYVWLARALLIGRPWEVIAEGLYGPQEVLLCLLCLRINGSFCLLEPLTRSPERHPPGLLLLDLQESVTVILECLLQG